MFKFCKKLENIKYEVKDWSKKQFGNLHDKIFKIKQKFDYVDGKLG